MMSKILQVKGAGDRGNSQGLGIWLDDKLMVIGGNVEEGISKLAIICREDISKLWIIRGHNAT